jgi:hypothetical protein
MRYYFLAETLNKTSLKQLNEDSTIYCLRMVCQLNELSMISLRRWGLRHYPSGNYLPYYISSTIDTIPHQKKKKRMSSHLQITQLITFLYRIYQSRWCQRLRTSVFFSKWDSLQGDEAILLTGTLECLYTMGPSKWDVICLRSSMGPWVPLDVLLIAFVTSPEKGNLAKKKSLCPKFFNLLTFLL